MTPASAVAALHELMKGADIADRPLDERRRGLGGESQCFATASNRRATDTQTGPRTRQSRVK